MKKILFIYIISLLPLSAKAVNIQPHLKSLPSCTGEDLTCDFSESEIREALGLDSQDHIDFRFLESLNWEHHEFHAEDYDLADVPFKYEALVHKANLKMPSNSAPIWPSFIENFKRCAPGCIPANYGTYGKRGGRSCHPSGRAVDVGAIICSGRTYKAINGGKFSEFVGCMRGQMKTLYQNGKHITLGHRDHAHFSNGCHDRGRYTY